MLYGYVNGRNHYNPLKTRLKTITFQIYISCNSGARIGLAEEIKPLFKIAWEDPEDIDKGFKYLYLTVKDYETISHLKSVRAVLVDEDGEQRYTA